MKGVSLPPISLLPSFFKIYNKLQRCSKFGLKVYGGVLKYVRKLNFQIRRARSYMDQWNRQMKKVATNSCSALPPSFKLNKLLKHEIKMRKLS